MGSDKIIGIPLSAKVHGTSTPVKVFGRTIPKPFTIPVGLILMSANGSVPTGWTRFSAADGRYIVGAGGSYAVGSTGGAASYSASLGSNSVGGHTHTSSEQNGVYGNSTGAHAYSSAPQAAVSGAHSHTLQCTYTPSYNAMTLIKLLDSQVQYPANAVFLCTSPLSGFSTFTSNSRILKGSLSNSTSNYVVNGLAVSTSGVHSHDYKFYIYSGGYPLEDYPLGGHAHTASLSSLTENIKRCALRGLYKTVAYDNPTQIIGMWESATPPTGWGICNGVNGTIDLRDYYVELNQNGTGSKSGDNTVGITLTTDTNSWTHDHYYDALMYRGTNSRPAATVSHSHSASATVSYTPLYYALNFIQYTG